MIIIKLAMISKSIRNHKQILSYFSIRTLYDFSWRFTILILPWQARWFASASLGGWPFEQGRLSFYISWLPMIASIVLGYFLPKANLPKKLSANIFWFFAILSGITIITNPIDIRAVSMWWLQIFLLTAFFIILLRTKTQFEKVLFWIILSLIPHALFAVMQFFIQYVPGTSLLGMASQDPKSLGVSVIQVADMRFLRAYGGFPHPNILGGFMVFGILIGSWLYSQLNCFAKHDNKANQAESREADLKRLFFLAIIPIFTTALFYSFSRSAWLALLVGMTVMIAITFLRGSTQKAEGLKVLSVILLTFLPLTIIHWDLAASRFGLTTEPARLERQSTNARTDSIKDGVRIFQAYPIFGTGPNAELPALAKLTAPLNKGGEGGLSKPLEPPHNVFILILANWGTAGSLVIFGFILFLLRQIMRAWPYSSPIYKSLAISLLAAWLTISLFDHYLYSFWPGQLLSLLTAYILIFWLISNKNTNSMPTLKNSQSKLDGSIE